MAARDSTRRTLACRLTPVGEGGISLIELSGPDSAAILDRLFQNPRGVCVAQMAPGRLLYGRLVRDGAPLDEVLLECVQAGERGVFVINCHGGALASQRTMGALAAEGARPARENEYLARQRRVGLLDRIQEEAARRIPHALTLRAAQMLVAQHEGALRAVRDELLRRAELQPPDWPWVTERLRRLLATAAFGRGMVRPPRLVIAGRPNVGKSTLANALLRFDRMLVHPEPGTTRDTIEESLSLRGLPFTLVDTAGLRVAASEIEREGVRRGAQALRRADIALLVFDASVPLQEEDLRILARGGKGIRLPVLNKSDLPAAVPAGLIEGKTGCRPVVVSAASGAGLGEMEERIVAAAYPQMPAQGEAALFTLRQERLVKAALQAADRQDRARLAAAMDALTEIRTTKDEG
ncbi:MAG: GTPase [Candidatus Brocadiia bacterium]